MKISKDFPFISVFFLLISGILFPIFTSGDDPLISRAMIQAGWCVQGDSVCILNRYVWIILPILILGVILDLGLNFWRKRSAKVEKNTPIPAMQAAPSVVEKAPVPQELKWVAVIYDVTPWRSVTYWAAIRIDNEINCHNLIARLDKITYKGVDLWADNPGHITAELNIDVINPTGDNLVWNREGNTCLLHVVRESSDDRGAVIIFNNGRTSIPLPSGQFEIEISLRGKAIKDTKIVKTLEVTVVDFPHYEGRHKTGLAWLKE